MKSLVIAVFVKDDLIQLQIDNLLLLKNISDYNVIFFQDGISDCIHNKYNSDYYHDKHKRVGEIINKNLKKFNSAIYQISPTNIGPSGLCKLSMDYAFKTNDFCIYLEDDVFLANNALIWFTYTSTLLHWDTYKFISAESIYYDSRSEVLSDETIEHIKTHISNNKYQQYFIEINKFLTSSVFATTKDIWNSEIRVLRGGMNGENQLNDAIQLHNWKCIFPVVPFAKDIGMLHEDGWSVAWHTKDGVREIKNVYIMADMFDTPDEFIQIQANLLQFNIIH
jgi:hypothetical protein